uniref:Uncharacterized protein n=1 Tax=Oryza brachyantha TaxID=4533 RepID=J3LIK5_ORYBR
MCSRLASGTPTRRVERNSIACMACSLWNTVAPPASSSVMPKLALAMISAAFRTTPFSTSMQLFPDATMSLHLPSILEVVSSITPIMSCTMQARGWWRRRRGR